MSSSSRSIREGLLGHERNGRKCVGRTRLPPWERSASGPSGLPDAPSFEEAAALARGPRLPGRARSASPAASGSTTTRRPALGEALARGGHRALRARAARRVHGPRRAREEVQDGARHARPHGRAREGGRRRGDRLPPGLPARPRARAGDRRRRRPARRPARAARGEGPARAVRGRGDGARARARDARRRARDRVAGRLRPAGARLRAHARDERRRVHRRRRRSRPRSRRPTR